MKFLKQIRILALLPLFIAVGCDSEDDEPIIDIPVVIPTVDSSVPANEAVDVVINSSVAVTFDQEMDPNTINTTTFTLLEGNTEVSWSMVYLNNVVTFSPTSNLQTGTVYTAKLTTGVKDLNGVPIAADYIFSFTTGVAIDETVPTVVTTDPLSDATDVARNKVIAVTFSEEMNAASFTSTTLALAQGANPVTGSIEYMDKTVSFIPDQILDASLIYTATVSVGVKDLAGNAIAAAKTWSFTTGTEAGLSVVNLGASGNYVILAKTAINNSPTSAITGDIGLSPAATTFITGFSLTDATGYATSAQITGKAYAADMASPTSSNLTTAVENMLTAYTDASGRPTPDFLNLNSGNIGGETLDPGLYKWGTTVTIPGDVTLSGDADAVWIFQIDNDLTMSADKNITLAGGAQAKNIFWQVAGEAVIGANSHFEGVILSMTGITLETGASYNGRMLAQTAVILDSNSVTKPE